MPNLFGEGDFIRDFKVFKVVKVVKVVKDLKVGKP